MRKFVSLAGMLGALALAVAGPAYAHAKLTSAEPAANATVAPPRQIVLQFNEKMVAGFSGFDLTSADGAKVAVKTTVGKDGMSMVGVPAKPLAKGAYKVAWHAVTADSHRMQGDFTFTVR
ncbi:copper homeostasis periplasmic binding protein CopC [Phenylobacterium sp. 58.2.17]|uniref:copper homeostasis periplasmic binding protein CopC n=1 Tax=Phenylobacterium sp. 58.2.17 TaxID=2969306 RepID=UPI002264B29B|nr:copper homeostasis periplasmic binding protein CopC [Phenylobacterium sp. 58.2.17]MCX7587791.1 copper homeostasis periplasmic binding protein CopC [Phenylobacterium sp. 58.2.17]